MRLQKNALTDTVYIKKRIKKTLRLTHCVKTRKNAQKRILCKSTFRYILYYAITVMKRRNSIKKYAPGADACSDISTVDGSTSDSETDSSSDCWTDDDFEPPNEVEVDEVSLHSNDMDNIASTSDASVANSIIWNKTSRLQPLPAFDEISGPTVLVLNLEEKTPCNYFLLLFSDDILEHITF